jgi:hypothetical protein
MDKLQITMMVLDNFRKRMMIASRSATQFTETYSLPLLILLRFVGTNVALYGGNK